MHSNTIVGFTIAAFVIFITVRGELPVYLGFILGTKSSIESAPLEPAAPNPANAPKAASNDATQNFGTVVKSAEAAAFIFG